MPSLLVAISISSSIKVQLNPSIEVGQPYPSCRWLIVTVLLVQRGEHNIELELTFSCHGGYVFHDSRGFEAGDTRELEIVQDFVRRKSRERKLNDRLHAIWFVLFGIYGFKFRRSAFQVLRSDGQCPSIAGSQTLRRYLSG
jgi:hypothetical protein